MEANRPFWMICATHMFVEVFFLIQVALIPVFIGEFKLSLLEASLVATVPSLVQLLMNFPSGFLTERFNIKHLLFASMVVEGFSALLVSQTDNFWMIVLGVSMMRVSSPLYHISGLSCISQIVRSGKMNRSMGFHNALGSLGSAIGLLSLSVFLSTIGWRSIYMFWAVPILIWAFIILRSSQLEAKMTQKSETKKGKMPKRLPLIFSVGFSIFMVAFSFKEVGNTGVSTFMTTYLVKVRGLSEATASLIFGLGPLIGMMGSLISGYIGEKIGAKKMLSMAILGSAFSFLILGFLTTFYLLTIVYLAYAFFSSSVWAPINTILADITPTAERGLSFSIFFFIQGLIVSTTPTIAATVIGSSGLWSIFPFGIVFLAAGLITLQLLPYTTKTPESYSSVDAT